MESENVMKFVLISVFAVFVCLIMPFWVYTECRIDVPSYHMAVLIKKTGNDIDNAVEVAPDSSFKGVQKEVLGEGRYYYNPYNWDWVV